MFVRVPSVRPCYQSVVMIYIYIVVCSPGRLPPGHEAWQGWHHKCSQGDRVRT